MVVACGMKIEIENQRHRRQSVDHVEIARRCVCDCGPVCGDRYASCVV